MRLRVNVAILGLGAFTLSAGCSYSAHPKNGAQQCGSGSPRCPDGYVCAADNRCYMVGHLPSGIDGAATDTMASDAPRDSGAATEAGASDGAQPDALGAPDLRPGGDPPASGDATGTAGGEDASVRLDLAARDDGKDAGVFADGRDSGIGPDLLPDSALRFGLPPELADALSPDIPLAPDEGPPDLAASPDQSDDVPPDVAPDLPADVCPSSFLADPLNCGACGHNCWGGACVSGVCQPAEVASGQHDPADIALDSDNVYWTALTDGKVLMAPRRGGSVEVVAENQYSPMGILIDEGYVYWTDFFNVGSIWRRPVTLASAPTLVADNLYYPCRMAVWGSFLYWTESSTAGVVRRTAKEGGGAVDILFSDQSSPYGIVADSAYLYWSVWQHILRTPITIGAVSTISAAESFPSDLRGDADNLYWLDGYAYTIRKAGKTTSDAAVTLASVTNTAIGDQIALDDTSVYWPDRGRLTISSVPKQGGPVTDWATNLAQPRGVAVDAELIVWTDVGTGQVMRLAK